MKTEFVFTKEVGIALASIATLLSVFCDPGLTQEVREVQLVDMQCRAINPPQPRNSPLRFLGRRFSIGDREFDEVAIFDSGESYAYRGEPGRSVGGGMAFVSCPISSGNNSLYRSLRLQVGLDDRSPNTHANTIVRLNILLDGEKVESRDLRRGTLQDVIVDTTNKSSLGLQIECIEDDGRRAGAGCPAVSFADMTLSSESVAEVRDTPSRARHTVFLTDMNCNPRNQLRQVDLGLRDNPDLLYINIGGRRFAEVAFLFSPGLTFSLNRRRELSISSATESACAVPPYFQRLNLSFGIDDANRQMNRGSAESIELNVYVNGQLAGSRSVRPGEIRSWSIPLSQPQSINLEAKCVGVRFCSRLSFTQISLE